MRISSVTFSPRQTQSALVAWTLMICGTGYAAEAPWQELQIQNRELRSQLQTQQKQLDELRVQMERLTASQASSAAVSGSTGNPAPRDGADRKLVITGEFGFALFAGGNDDAYRNREFRIDDANLRLEAALGRDTYLFGELQLAKREGLDENFHLGEFYLEFENVSGAFGVPDRLLNVRLGRVDIPFGEEYQSRDPLTNPLITHSLSDVWGTDEGVEVYGEFGRASYAFAVQNGSSKTTRDYNADKALTLRIGYEVTSQLHVSASAMRTGELATAREPLSEVWIGNNVFRNIGSSSSTTHEADLAEVDASYHWRTGRVAAAAGLARYRDNDTLADNSRRFTYYQIETVQDLSRQIYGAVRFSTLEVENGYPLAGIGNFSKYFLTALKTKELQRWSLGGGFRFTPSLILKFDYTLENGKLTTGAARDHRLFSVESVLGF